MSDVFGEDVIFMGLQHILYCNNVRIIEWRKEYWIVNVLRKLSNHSMSSVEGDEDIYCFGLVEFFAFKRLCDLCLEYPLLIKMVGDDNIIDESELRRTCIILEDFIKFSNLTEDDKFTHKLIW